MEPKGTEHFISRFGASLTQADGTYWPSHQVSFDSIEKKISVNLLKGRHWLNSDLLNYFFAHLQCDTFADNAKVLFVTPMVTQFIRIGCDDPKLFLDPLKASAKDLILFPVNNNEGEHQGGTHWSLLAFSRRDDAFFSFDSFHNSNIASTVRLVDVLKAALEAPWADFVKATTLQQVNGFDCGVHVYANAEHITRYFEQNGTIRGAPLLEQDSAIGMRSEMLRIVEACAGINQAGKGVPVREEPNIKLQLAKALQKLPCANLKNSSAIKRVPWAAINIPGCSTAQLQQHLSEIIAVTSKTRTFREILADFEVNGQKLLRMSHLDFPKRPLDPHVQYSQDHKDEIVKELHFDPNYAKNPPVRL